MEAVFLSEAGAAAGIILGIAAGNILARFMRAPLVFPWFWIFAAVLACSALGVGFGVYPAWKAAQLRPVEALRFE